MTTRIWILCSLLILLSWLGESNLNAQPNYDYTKLKREKLGRGVVAIKKDDSTNVITWRYLSSDPITTTFNIYRNGTKINPSPIDKATFFEDKTTESKALTYTVKAVVNGKEESNLSGKYTLPANAPIGYINIPLDIPSDGVTPDGQKYTYSPGDASIGDVDGDGEYEIILKWDPSNAHDNSHNGYTGNVYIDCYKIDGKKLWRIDLGRNIRAGAHYTQFMVYDLDGDNKAEIVMKTADGTTDGRGSVIGDVKADYRNQYGFIIEGPEYLTIFNGETGKAMQTIDYIPQRGDVCKWGDCRGNRVDRFLAAIAYLDGVHPSVVMCRGYYTRTVLAAFDWRDGKLASRWVFDSDMPGNQAYAGQGNHNLRVGDVDGDGCDEIIYGSCAINNDGTGFYSTGLGHGDALHLTVFDPTRKGMQVWDCHENKRDGSTFRDAATGKIIFQLPSKIDVGRAMAADIDPNYPGVEMWAIDTNGIFNVKGERINAPDCQVSINMACWWDGDLTRELLDKVTVSKYDPATGRSNAIFKAEGCLWNNGTKSNPAIQGDILGDWREEILFRTADNKNLRLYVSTEPTGYRFHTFLEDPVYRISMATQNVAYNQPTQPGFYFGSDLGKIFKEKEIVTKDNFILLDAGMDYDSYNWSVGGTNRERKLTTNDIPEGKRTEVELKVTYRGYEFTDHVFVTLNAK
ncbi:rhamnogalacturonan lyase [Dysgonomonas macrotermitis]|uniref:Rhamnogalacturonan endolyase n=1 Tax=Dysgonomonas macrotermitis TaxID=1346286 RepID=A0A1M4TLA5_9BACT|nr:rhamnogalacturonan lyase [Dysgonomonas macrotermitis]SHE45269.1 rhamnogalacturonan endolyase [Dysgonomonas macrotermitis]